MQQFRSLNLIGLQYQRHIQYLLCLWSAEPLKNTSFLTALVARMRRIDKWFCVVFMYYVFVHFDRVIESFRIKRFVYWFSNTASVLRRLFLWLILKYFRWWRKIDNVSGNIAIKMLVTQYRLTVTCLLHGRNHHILWGGRVLEKYQSVPPQ